MAWSELRPVQKQGPEAEGQWLEATACTLASPVICQHHLTAALRAGRVGGDSVVLSQAPRAELFQLPDHLPRKVSELSAERELFSEHLWAPPPLGTWGQWTVRLRARTLEPDGLSSNLPTRHMDDLWQVIQLPHASLSYNTGIAIVPTSKEVS